MKRTTASDKTSDARPATKPAAKAKSLSQAQADFTAEGSPPPGQVAGVPVPKSGTPADTKPASSKPDL